MSLHIAILYGSVREARAGIRVVRFLTGALRRRGHTTTVVDAAELPFHVSSPLRDLSGHRRRRRVQYGAPFARACRSAR